jgi:hypothetical protein
MLNKHELCKRNFLWATRNFANTNDWLNNMNKVISVIVALFLCACSAVFPNKNTETRVWKTASCNGAAGWEGCYQKAAAKCPNGFDFANKEENPTSGNRHFEFSCR